MIFGGNETEPRKAAAQRSSRSSRALTRYLGKHSQRRAPERAVAPTPVTPTVIHGGGGALLGGGRKKKEAERRRRAVVKNRQHDLEIAVAMMMGNTLA